MKSKAIRPKSYSKKQRKILTWWAPQSPVKDYDGIICDGSIRAGKTFPMADSYIRWAFTYFDGQQFGICGKTIGTLRRNVISWLKPYLESCGFQVQDKLTENLLIITKGTKTNFFYLFGGYDESSQDLIQGFTAAGMYFDEVALMPKSFVDQATGRCSVEGAKIWFNCNPDSPSHWFKVEWLDQAKKKRLLHIHFTMEDNPSLSVRTIERLSNLYTGVFFKRFILGLWVMAEGAIYDMFGDDNQYDEIPQYIRDTATQWISVDYGTQNPMVYLHVYDDGGTNVFVDDEYYYDGRKSGIQKTDSQYADDLDAFCEGKNIRGIIIDPSAASFIVELRNRGYIVRLADNTVEDGIRLTATCFARKAVRVNKRCKNLIRELFSYVWDTKKTDKGKEQPIKKDDHGPDALRYFVKTIFKPRRLMRDAA